MGVRRSITAELKHARLDDGKRGIRDRSPCRQIPRQRSERCSRSVLAPCRRGSTESVALETFRFWCPFVAGRAAGIESMTRIAGGSGLIWDPVDLTREGSASVEASRRCRPTLWPLRPPQSSLRPAVRAAASYQISRRSFWGSPRETPSAPGSTTWRRGQRGTRAGRPT
jgi:hypothetical protein